MKVQILLLIWIKCPLELSFVILNTTRQCLRELHILEFPSFIFDYPRFWQGKLVKVSFGCWFHVRFDSLYAI